MKKFILCICSVCLLTLISSAQRNKIASNRAGKTTVKKSAKSTPANSANTTQAIILNSTASYSARSGSNLSMADRYSITDPTVKALNARASGADVQLGKSGIVGMPKRAYGFGNGHLTLYTTGATSSGTITGNGAIGTGSSLGNIGSYGPAIGLNGKSPYAGSTMWGNAIGMILQHADTAVRVSRKKE